MKKLFIWIKNAVIRFTKATYVFVFPVMAFLAMCTFPPDFFNPTRKDGIVERVFYAERQSVGRTHGGSDANPEFIVVMKDSSLFSMGYYPASIELAKKLPGKNIRIKYRNIFIGKYFYYQHGFLNAPLIAKMSIDDVPVESFEDNVWVLTAFYVSFIWWLIGFCAWVVDVWKKA